MASSRKIIYVIGTVDTYCTLSTRAETCKATTRIFGSGGSSNGFMSY